jgi:gallate dioxygenase
MTHAEYARLGGFEGTEVIMWLVMRGALAPKIRTLHRSYYLPSMTGIATAIYENDSADAPRSDGAYLERINRQLAGAEQIEGSYPFTLARSVKSYRLNKFLHRLIEPAWRARFRTAQETLFEEAQLSGEERALVRALDWRGMIHYGVSFFMLEKLGAAVGVSNLHIYAAMRGQTLEEFQRTRNAPGALYSVAGTDAAPAQDAWMRADATR